MADDNPNGDEEQDGQQNETSPEEQNEKLSELSQSELISIIHNLRGRVRGLGGEVEALAYVPDSGTGSLSIPEDDAQKVETLAERAEAFDGMDDAHAETLRQQAANIADTESFEDINMEAI